VFWKKQELSLTDSNNSSLVRLYDEASEGDIAVAGFYYDFRNQDEQGAANVMETIQKQLVSRGEVLEPVRTAFKKAKVKLGG